MKKHNKEYEVMLDTEIIHQELDITVCWHVCPDCYNPIDKPSIEEFCVVKA